MAELAVAGPLQAPTVRARHYRRLTARQRALVDTHLATGGRLSAAQRAALERLKARFLGPP